MNKQGHDLIDRFIDEDLTEEEIQELAILVETTPSIKEGLVEQLCLTGGIRSLSVTNADREQLTASIRCAIAAIPVGPEGITTTVMKALRGHRRRARTRLFAKVAAAIFLLAGVAAIVRSQLRPGIQLRPSTLATVAESVEGFDVRRGNETRAVTAGFSLEEGDLLLGSKDGAKLTAGYADGTTFTLYGTTEMRLHMRTDTGKQMELDRGRADFSVAPQDAPLVVTTPLGKATVVGTVFEVAATEDATSLNVRNGVVALENAFKDRITVKAWESATARRGQRQIDHIQPLYNTNLFNVVIDRAKKDERYQDIDVSAYRYAIDEHKQRFSYSGVVLHKEADMVVEERDEKGTVLNTFSPRLAIAEFAPANSESKNQVANKEFIIKHQTSGVTYDLSKPDLTTGSLVTPGTRMIRIRCTEALALEVIALDPSTDPKDDSNTETP